MTYLVDVLKGIWQNLLVKIRRTDIKDEQLEESKYEQLEESKDEQLEESKDEQLEESKDEQLVKDHINTFIEILKENINKNANILIEKTLYTIKTDKARLLEEIKESERLMEISNENFKRNSNKRIIKNLIMLIDSMNRCKDTKCRDIELLKQICYQILEEEDVVIIDPNIGDNFDNIYHEAFEKIETEKFSDNTIIDIIEIGCKFKSGIPIKRAMVKVCKHYKKENIMTKGE